MTGGERERGGATVSLVSVIIPVYNGERFLAEAIESVLAQDHHPLELIVVDDGSTDASSGVAASYQGVNVKRIEHAGPSAARNAGLALASGDVVVFLDADDRMTNGRLSAQLAYLDRHPEIGCLLTRQVLSVEPGAMPIPSPRQADLGAPTVGSMVLRRDALERAGGLDPGFGWTEWMELLFRLQDAGVEVAVEQEVGLIRRVHGDNRSRKVEELRDGLARAVRGHLDRRRAGQTS